MKGRLARDGRDSEADDGSLKAMYLSFAALLLYDQGNSSYIAAPAIEYIAKKLSDAQTVVSEEDAKEMAMKEVSKFTLFDGARVKEMERRGRFIEAGGARSGEKGATVTILKKNEYTTKFPARRRDPIEAEKVLEDGSERVVPAIRSRRSRRPMRPSRPSVEDFLNRVIEDNMENEIPQRSAGSRIMSDIGLEVLGIVQSASDAAKKLIKTPTDALNWLSKQLYALGGLYWRSIGAPLIDSKKEQEVPEESANRKPVTTDPGVKRTQKRRTSNRSVKFDAHRLLKDILNMIRDYYSTFASDRVETAELLVNIDESLELVRRLEETVDPNVHYDRHIVAIVSLMNDHFKKTLSANNNVEALGGDGKEKEKEPAARAPVVDEASEKLLALFENFDRKLAGALEKVYSTEYGYSPGGMSQTWAELDRKKKTEKANLEQRMEEAITRLNNHAKMIATVLELTDPRREGAIKNYDLVEDYAMSNFQKIIETYKESKKPSKTSGNSTTTSITTTTTTSGGVNKPTKKLKDEDMRRIYDFFDIPTAASLDDGEQLHDVLEKTREHIVALRKMTSQKDTVTAKKIVASLKTVKSGLSAAKLVLKNLSNVLKEKQLPEKLDVSSSIPAPILGELKVLYDIITATIGEYNEQKKSYNEKEAEWRKDLKENADSIKALTVSKNEIEDRLKAADTKNAVLENAATVLTAEVADFKTKHELETKKCADLELLVRTSNEKIEKLESDIKILNGRIEEIIAKSAVETLQFEKEKRELSERLSQSSETVKFRSAEIDNLTRRLEDEKKNYLADVAKLKEALATTQEDGPNLEKKIAELEKARKMEVAKHEALKTELDRELDRIRSDHSKAQEALSLSQKTESTLNKDIESARAELSKANENLEIVKKKYALKETKLQSLHNDIEEMKRESFFKMTEYDAQREKMVAAQKALESAHAIEKEKWTANDREQTERLRSLSESVETSRKASETNKVSLNVAEKELAEAKDLLTERERENTEMVEKIKTLQATVSTCELEKIELQKKVVELANKVSALTDDVSDVEKKLQEKDSALGASQKALSESRAETKEFQKQLNLVDGLLDEWQGVFSNDEGKPASTPKTVEKEKNGETVSKMLETYKSIKNEHKKLRDVIEEHKSTLERERESHEKLLSEVSSQNENLVRDLASKSALLTKEVDMLSSLRQKFEENEKLLGIIKAENVKLKTESNETKKSLAMGERKLEFAKREIETIKVRLVATETKYENVDTRLSRALSEANTSKEMYATLLSEANTSKEKYAELWNGLVDIEKRLIELCQDYGIQTKETKSIVDDINYSLEKLKAKKKDLDSLLETYAGLLSDVRSSDPKNPAISIYQACMTMLGYATSSVYDSKQVRTDVQEIIEQMKTIIANPYASVKFVDVGGSPSPAATTTTTATTTTPTTGSEKFGGKTHSELPTSVFSISDEWDTNSETGSESSESGYEV